MFSKIRRHLAWLSELKALDAQIERDPRPTLAKPDETTPGRVVWRLPVPGKPDAYMAMQAGQADHDLFVVPVSGPAFNRLWLGGGLSGNERPDGCRLRAELATDSKYHHAVAGFAEGQRNPVPLARVGLGRENGTPEVRFSDGVTRTFWLLANHVEAFPVVVAGEKTAAELAKLAGADSAPVRVSELFRQTEPPVIPPKRLDTKKEGGEQSKPQERPERPAKPPRRRSPRHGVGLD
ncbi:TPA: fertility inhibition factor FiwA [Yersinia enterocolitica]